MRQSNHQWGLVALLFEGIGDTIRVSVPGDPVKEIPIAYSILRTLNIRKVVCGHCIMSYLRPLRNRFEPFIV